jgi:hypothetical protein
MVRFSLVAAVIGLLALTTVASISPSGEVSTAWQELLEPFTEPAEAPMPDLRICWIEGALPSHRARSAFRQHGRDRRLHGDEIAAMTKGAREQVNISSTPACSFTPNALVRATPFRGGAGPGAEE